MRCSTRWTRGRSTSPSTYSPRILHNRESSTSAAERIGNMLELLTRATCYHGVFPHFMNGRTGATIPFTRKDDGGDLVETSFLIMGLLCAREYFKRRNPQESKIRGLVNYLWN